MRLPPLLRFIRFLFRHLTHIEIIGKEYIPTAGNYIIASNHLGLADALVPFLFLDNNNIVVLVGEKWQKIGILRWLGRKLNFIFVDRFHPDLKAIRQVIERMRAGDVLVITPEGTRSKTGVLLEGKPGVSYLAAKPGVPILPAGISGSFDPVFFGQLKRLHRPHVTVYVGKPFSLPRLPPDAQGRDEALRADTEEIMCRIASMLPPEQRGFYADHPHLKEILGS